MEIKIQSIHFDATEKLQAFIEKKIAKLEKTYEDIQKVEGHHCSCHCSCRNGKSQFLVVHHFVVYLVTI